MKKERRVFDLDELDTMLTEATGGFVEHGHAGGTVALWAVSAHTGNIVCLTELDGPFTDREQVEVDGFLVGIYEGPQEKYLDGEDTLIPLWEVPSDLEELKIVLHRAARLMEKRN